MKCDYLNIQKLDYVNIQKLDYVNIQNFPVFKTTIKVSKNNHR